MDMSVASRQAAFCAFNLTVHTPAARCFVDITEDVMDGVRTTGVESGIAVVTSRHTTAAIVVNEHEPLLLQDLNVFLSGLAPEDSEYAHNTAPCAPGEGPNGHAHCQALLLNASASIPVLDGRLSLGRYQRIFLVELDRPRTRNITISVLGC